MIEVEKKFQPTEEQLTAMLEGADFLGEKNITDTYYDTPDFTYLKKGIRLRSRDGGWEIKATSKELHGATAQVMREIDTEPEILEELGFSKEENLTDVVEKNLQVIYVIRTNRWKYKKEGFTIDVDKTDIGYDMVEIELLVEKKEGIDEADQKILDFAKRFSFEIKKLPSKTVRYLEHYHPDIAKEVYK